mmetsp:Transcript_16729/g.35189  ORF Transcript_16729/g.35189 Transcript_16729/m.35189 type:complete len:339 (-) Transcript_16729:163-1179(-)
MAEGYRDFIAGTVGGFSGKLLDYPFDTVKVLLQTQNSLPSATTANIQSSPSSTTSQKAKSQRPVYRGAIHCLRHTIETRGFLSLYQGISSPLLGSMAENAVLFLSYGEVKRMLGEKPGEKELTLLQLASAGGVAGGIVSFVLNPFEVIKVQMQVMNSAANTSAGVTTRKYDGVMDCVLKTVRNEGLAKGLYRGQTSMLLREIPGNFCWYGVYEGVCLSQIPEGGTKRDLTTSTHLLGGASAGVAYWTAFYPADTIGSQLRANPQYASKGFTEVFLDVYKREGLRGLYRGWGITAMRAAPAHALIFAMYERTMGAFRRWDPEGEEDGMDRRSGSISHSS